MIRIITGQQSETDRQLMEQAYRLRHSVFVAELDWANMAGDEAREVDQFDTPEAVNMLAVAEGVVVGYQRLLPTTRPHLQTEVFADLCEVERPHGPNVWEYTRFCSARAYRESEQTELTIRRELVHAAVKWGLENGVDQFLFQIDPYRMLRLMQYHFRMVPLGLPRKYNGEDVIAVVGHFDRRTLERLSFLRDNPAASMSGNRGLNRAFTKSA